VVRNDREEVDAMHLTREFLRRGVAIGVILVAVNPPIFPCRPIWSRGTHPFRNITILL